MDDMKRLTLGSYQIKIADRYIFQHLKNDPHFGIFVQRNAGESLSTAWVRAQIQSRFAGSRTHNCWIKYTPNLDGFESLQGILCSCKVGERTLGCCSHLTAVVKYLGLVRHEGPVMRKRNQSEWGAIDCGVD